MSHSSTAPACRKLRATGTYSGKQGFDYFEGIARETVGCVRHMHASAHDTARRPRQGAQA
jgi:uncharacterized RmlC-like cupin family protein